MLEAHVVTTSQATFRPVPKRELAGTKDMTSKTCQRLIGYQQSCSTRFEFTSSRYDKQYEPNFSYCQLLASPLNSCFVFTPLEVL